MSWARREHVGDGHTCKCKIISTFTSERTQMCALGLRWPERLAFRQAGPVPPSAHPLGQGPPGGPAAAPRLGCGSSGTAGGGAAPAAAIPTALARARGFKRAEQECGLPAGGTAAGYLLCPAPPGRCEELKGRGSFYWEASFTYPMHPSSQLSTCHEDIWILGPLNSPVCPNPAVTGTHAPGS